MKYTVRNADPAAYKQVGQLMVDVYAALDGFPKPDQLPGYYHLLANVGDLMSKPGTELLVAVNDQNQIHGAVVYFGDILQYGAGTFSAGSKVSGFRLLAVHRDARGRGVGKLLINACLEKAKQNGHQEVIIHTTKAMQQAWDIYESMGFKRSPDLDFNQNNVEVFGLRYFIF